MELLLPLLDKIEKTSEEQQQNSNILIYIKFLEATVSILKDYEHINTIGKHIIHFIERSINQNNIRQPYKQEVSYQKYII